MQGLNYNFYDWKEENVEFHYQVNIFLGFDWGNSSQKWIMLVYVYCYVFDREIVLYYYTSVLNTLLFSLLRTFRMLSGN